MQLNGTSSLCLSLLCHNSLSFPHHSCRRCLHGVRDWRTYFCFSGCQQDYSGFYEEKHFIQSHASRYTHRTHTTQALVILNNNIALGSQNYKVEAVAGSGNAGRVDGRPDECCFNGPQGIAVDEASHSCFVVESGNHTIRKISFVNLN